MSPIRLAREAASLRAGFIGDRNGAPREPMIDLPMMIDLPISFAVKVTYFTVKLTGVDLM